MLARGRAQTAPAPPFDGPTFDGRAQPMPAPVFQGFSVFFGVSPMLEYTFAL